MNKTDYLFTQDVVKIMPFTRNTLNNMVKRGDFPKPIVLSERKRLYKKSDVNNWLKSKGLPEL